MSEYIKREDAIAKEEIIITNTGREVCAVRTCNLWEIPAADVEPVVRGKWKHNSNRPDRLICSICDAGYDMMRFESEDLKFCSNCGAKMTAYGRSGDA